MKLNFSAYLKSLFIKFIYYKPMQKNKNTKNHKLTNFLKNNQVCILKKVSKKFDRNNELERLERLKDNLDWFNSNYEYFNKYHKNQYVAIKDKRFLDKDIELDRLVKRLKIKDYVIQF